MRMLLLQGLHFLVTSRRRADLLWIHGDPSFREREPVTSGSEGGVVVEKPFMYGEKRVFSFKSFKIGSPNICNIVFAFWNFT